MSVFTDLINQVEDKTLRERLLQEADRLNKQKKFGLVFEEHLPECTPLYEVPVKRGSNVARKTGKMNDVLRVIKIVDGIANCVPRNGGDAEEISVDELVSVAEFGEAIYPQLIPIDTVENAPDSDLWHTLIQADNYHALQLLEYLYAGKVDCIYIDPPYNTGARDWKYNNDYVDNTDSYRHSKWLSMMQKRLKIAKRILNPEDSVLIVTIDEKEYLHLGCLLEEMFPEARIQMVSSVINPSGSSRKDLFSRSDEYIFFVFFGNAHVNQNDNDMLHPVSEKKARWDGLMRRGDTGRREARPNLFYPVFFKKTDGSFFGVGDSLPLNVPRINTKVPEGCFAQFPISENGREATWGVQPSKFIEKQAKGYIRFGKYRQGIEFRAISHLQEGTIKAIDNGDIEILGRDPDGAYILGKANKTVTPMTTWVQASHSAGDQGASFLRRFFPYSRFNFPKSIYAVRDAINFIVADNSDALIVDFFAGSGTTLHAVNLLNAEDDGHRRCIMVTNNEVSSDEAKALTEQGYQPGDDEWEKFGIARYVTWPRTVCSIEGHDINGVPLKGDYLANDADGNPIPMSQGFKANAAFFKLGFLDKDDVALGRQFKEILPLLWLKAGAVGKCPELPDEMPDMLILPENKLAILVSESSFMSFDEQLDAHPEIDTVFIVTDSEKAYREMISSIRAQNTYQLYRNYLDNFRINARR